MNNFVYDVNSVILENGVVRFGGDLQQFGGVKIDLTDARNDLDFIDAIMSAVISLTDNVREDGAKINDEEKVNDQENISLDTDVMLHLMEQKRNEKKYNNLPKFFNKYAKSDAGLIVYDTPNGYETALTLNGENRTFGEPQSTVFGSLINCAFTYNRHIAAKQTDGFNKLNDGGYAGKSNATNFKF